MNRFFKNSSKLPRGHLLEIAVLCSVAMLLIFAAVFISQGGMQKVNHVLAVYHITQESQTSCVFPCNNTGYTMEALIPMQNGSIVSSVSPSTNINFQWNAGSYGANHFAIACSGGSLGSAYMCTIQRDTANTNFGTCVPGYSTGGECIHQACTATDKTGACVTYVCDAWNPTVYHPPVGCGNADDYYGNACFGPGGGTVVSGWQPACQWAANNAGPGYDGNYPASTVTLTAPATPGTYTYWFCSNWLLHANAFNSSLTPLPCLGTNVTVITPPPSCTMTPPTQSVTLPTSPSITYSTNAYTTGITYAVDGVSRGAPSGNPFVPIGATTAGSHNVIMTATGAGGTATCGTNGDVVVNAQPATSCSFTPTSVSITNAQSANFTYTNPNANSTTYSLDGGAPVTPSGGAISLSGLSVGSHSVVMTVTNTTNTTTCTEPITVTGAPLPVVSVTAGGASSVTIPVNGTTTIVWSTSGANPGAAALSSTGGGSATVTNFGSITSGANTAPYLAGNIVVNGYVYQFGGYTTSYISNYYRAPVGADLTVSANWTYLGAMPNYAPVSGTPILINNRIYLFGGVAWNTQTWTSTICSIPVASIGTPGTWDCTGTMNGAPIGGSDPIIVGDYVYRIGGINGSYVSDIGRAPLATPTVWTKFASALPAVIFLGNPTVIGNYVYTFGGYNGTVGTSVIYRASISSGLVQAANWSNAGALPITTYGSVVVTDASYVYLIGGYNGTSLTSIYRASLSKFTSGQTILAGDWTSVGTLPSPGLYNTQPLIVNNTLYLVGGYSYTGTVANYINKVFALPFNDGLPYTSPSILPWKTDGGVNSASTWPINVNSVTYTLNATNVSGQSTATATVNEPDLCTNAPFSGIQNPLPSGVAAAGTTCSCANGALWTGSCSLTSPLANAPSITPVLNGGVTAIRRVQKGTVVTVKWNVTGLVVNDPNTDCSVYSLPAGAMPVQTWDKTGTSWTQPALAPTITVTGQTVLTLRCLNVSWAAPVTASAIVGVVPSYQEQ